MFTAKELNMVSRKYFRVIDQEGDIISLESKNTVMRIRRNITNTDTQRHLMRR